MNQKGYYLTILKYSLTILTLVLSFQICKFYFQNFEEFMFKFTTPKVKYFNYNHTKQKWNGGSNKYKESGIIT